MMMSGFDSRFADENSEDWFMDLVAGLGDLSTYDIREVQLPGWTQTAGDADIQLDIVEVPGMGNKTLKVPQIYIAIDGQSGFDANDLDIVENTDPAFGNFENIFISGRKFHDLNGNGVKNGGDMGLEGWVICWGCRSTK